LYLLEPFLGFVVAVLDGAFEWFEPGIEGDNACRTVSSAFFNASIESRSSPVPSLGIFPATSPNTELSEA
jgi:hypothetical protein